MIELKHQPFILSFSHAINLYLIEKYARDDYLYPKHDFLLRATINDRLFFDAGFLFPRGLNIFVSRPLNFNTLSYK